LLCDLKLCWHEEAIVEVLDEILGVPRLRGKQCIKVATVSCRALNLRVHRAHQTVHLLIASVPEHHIDANVHSHEQAQSVVNEDDAPGVDAHALGGGVTRLEQRALPRQQALPQ